MTDPERQALDHLDDDLGAVYQSEWSVSLDDLAQILAKHGWSRDARV